MPSTKEIPIVFLTGVGTREDVERVMALNPRGYILKSTTRDDLRRYLRRMLEKCWKTAEETGKICPGSQEHPEDSAQDL